MFAMIDGFSDFYNNINMFYMALMMVAPMALLMLLTMGSMYSNGMVNFFLYAGFILLFVIALVFTRWQTFVGNEQFLRSMIPHHSGAILMCREAPVTDQEIKDLCAEIIRSQQEEISRMKAILARY
jgi:hypothetical protein